MRSVGTVEDEPYDGLGGMPTGGWSQKGLAAGLGDLELDPESDGELWCEVWGREGRSGWSDVCSRKAHGYGCLQGEALPARLSTQGEKAGLGGAEAEEG